MYKCSNCGYYGAAVVEFDNETLRKLEKAERTRKKLRLQKKGKTTRD